MSPNWAALVNENNQERGG